MRKLILVLLMIPFSASADLLLADYELGFPAGHFVYAGGGGWVVANRITVADSSPLARPGQSGDNTFLDVEFDNTIGFGGFGQDFSPSPQNWGDFDGLSFWLFGSNSGSSYQFEIFDNRSNPGFDTAERFDTLFVDDFSGWAQVDLLFSDFTRAVDFQPGGAPDDGLGLTEMWGYAIVLDGGAGSLRFDDIRLTRVPEPGTLALFGIGLFGMGLARRRKKA